MVQELKELWSGVTLPCPSSPFKCVFIRAALTYILVMYQLQENHVALLVTMLVWDVLSVKKVFPSTRHNSGIFQDFSGYDENWTNRSAE